MHGGASEAPVFSRIKDFRGRCAEFVNCLAAASAGLACGVVEIHDNDGADADGGTMESDG